ncbi:hypothetical protein Y032_0196g1531 [Ancylostoma ceylanicum]|uniref:Uncharacterized protein n=1 Tax=Ancylostoma ceylanicum TaxID=53326 RepID=A0A016SPI6_9BILA|nr:hypothetical protein Y032_0196g1531 [Ancylostoma ceylanicum]
MKDEVVDVDRSRHEECATHSTSSEHRRGVGCVCALYSDFRRASDEQSQCFILPDSSGTNLPTPEGWEAIDSVCAHGVSYHCTTRVLFEYCELLSRAFLEYRT